MPRGRIEQLTRSRAFEGEPSLSPDGSLVAYRCDYRGNSDICVATIPATVVRNLTSESREDESHPSFSPDGRTIAFQSETRGVFTVPLEGGALTQITTTGGRPAWTPDGRSIVVQREHDSRGRLSRRRDRRIRRRRHDPRDAPHSARRRLSRSGGVAERHADRLQRPADAADRPARIRQRAARHLDGRDGRPAGGARHQ